MNGEILVVADGAAFAGKDYIRIGSYRQDLHKYPGTAKKLWDALNQTSFER